MDYQIIYINIGFFYGMSIIISDFICCLVKYISLQANEKWMPVSDG